MKKRIQHGWMHLTAKGRAELVARGWDGREPLFPAEMPKRLVCGGDDENDGFCCAYCAVGSINPTAPRA